MNKKLIFKRIEFPDIVNRKKKKVSLYNGKLALVKDNSTIFYIAGIIRIDKKNNEGFNLRTMDGEDKFKYGDLEDLLVLE